MAFVLEIGRAVDTLLASSGNENKKSRKAKGTRPPTYWTNNLVEAVGGQCKVQACHKVSHLQVHHIEQHAQGGSNRLTNLIVVCPNHHGACETGSINKTRQRAIFARKDRFTDSGFPEKWKEKVLAKETRRESSDSLFALESKS
jgi:hypothetical protein